MISINSSLAEEITGGKSFGKWSFKGCSFDSREISEGEAFFAIKGERSDGHDFVAEVLSRGAACAIVQKGYDFDFANNNLLVVDDTIKAMQELAGYVRSQFSRTVIAITGSIGKTTTKNMICDVLSAYGFNVYTNQKSYNGLIGLPYSVINMDTNVDYYVQEIGINCVDCMDLLVSIVKPDISILTNIHEAHIGNYPNFNTLINEKLNILNHTADQGIFIFNNCDNDLNKIINSKLEDIKEKNISTVLFGSKEGDVVLDECVINYNGFDIGVSVFGNKFRYHMHCFNECYVYGSLAVLSLLHVLKICDYGMCFKVISEFVPMVGRGRLHNLKISDRKLILVDESFNASKTAVINAINGAEKMKTHLSQNLKRRLVIVLGDLGELGDYRDDIYKDILPYLSVAECLITVGESSIFFHDNFDSKKEKMHFASVDEIISSRFWEDYFQEGDILFVKGSHFMKLFNFVQYLCQNFSTN